MDKMTPEEKDKLKERLAQIQSRDDAMEAVDEICPEEIYFLSVVRNRKTPTTRYTVHLSIKFLSYTGCAETLPLAICKALLKFLEEK